MQSPGADGQVVQEKKGGGDMPHGPVPPPNNPVPPLNDPDTSSTGSPPTKGPPLTRPTPRTRSPLGPIDRQPLPAKLVS